MADVDLLAKNVVELVFVSTKDSATYAKSVVGLVFVNTKDSGTDVSNV